MKIFISDVVRARDIAELYSHSVYNIDIPYYQIVEVFNHGWNTTCGDVNVWGQAETDLLGHWLGRGKCHSTFPPNMSSANLEVSCRSIKGQSPFYVYQAISQYINVFAFS